MNSKALFANNTPLKVSIPTPTTEEIERCQVEKDAKPKKKAKDTKGGDLKPSNIVAQERASEPSFECPIEFPHSSSRPPTKIIGSEEVPVERDEPGPQDRSDTITIPVDVMLEKGSGIF